MYNARVDRIDIELTLVRWPYKEADPPLLSPLSSPPPTTFPVL